MATFRAIFYLFIFCPLAAYSLTWEAQKEECQVKIELMPETVYLGESVQLNLTVIYPDTYQFDSDILLETLLTYDDPLQPHWAIDTWSVTVQQDQKKENVRHIRATLIPLIADTIPLSTTIKSQSNNSKNILSIETPVWNVEVLPAQIIPILKPASLLPLEPEYFISLTEKNREQLVPFTAQKERNQHFLNQRMLVWLGLVLLLLTSIIFWLVQSFYREWRKKQQAHEEVPSQINISQNAQQALQNLEKKAFDPIHHYMTLDAILNDYLTSYLKQSAARLTTDELLNALENDLHLPPLLVQKIAQLLDRADRVKFARVLPTIEQWQSDLETAQIVLKTCRI